MISDKIDVMELVQRLCEVSECIAEMARNVEVRNGRIILDDDIGGAIGDQLVLFDRVDWVMEHPEKALFPTEEAQGEQV